MVRKLVFSLLVSCEPKRNWNLFLTNEQRIKQLWRWISVVDTTGARVITYIGSAKDGGWVPVFPR